VSKPWYEPKFVGTVTKYVFVDSPNTTPQSLAVRAYEISDGVMIKETCFGMQITGSPEEVDDIITKLREIDPHHIFVKDRGFPPGDTRRCRANLGGARPGYYGHEFEMSLIHYVSKGLEAADSPESTEEQPKKIRDMRHTEGPLEVDRLMTIIQEEEQ
jgi:putative methanogenesis marker protein 6